MARCLTELRSAGEQQGEGRLAATRQAEELSSLWKKYLKNENRACLVTVIRFSQQYSDTGQVSSDKAGLRSSHFVKSESGCASVGACAGLAQAESCLKASA